MVGTSPIVLDHHFEWDDRHGVPAADSEAVALRLSLPPHSCEPRDRMSEWGAGNRKRDRGLAPFANLPYGE